jgi:hypothetical protein
VKRFVAAVHVPHGAGELADVVERLGQGHPGEVLVGHRRQVGGDEVGDDTLGERLVGERVDEPGDAS